MILTHLNMINDDMPWREEKNKRKEKGDGVPYKKGG